MAEQTHTPGPWEAQNTAGYDTHGQAVVYDASGKDVAIVYDGDANALLIAAAPDLLDALRRITMFIDDKPEEDALADIDEIARAAIEKAEGQGSQ